MSPSASESSHPDKTLGSVLRKLLPFVLGVAFGAGGEEKSYTDVLWVEFAYVNDVFFKAMLLSLNHLTNPVCQISEPSRETLVCAGSMKQRAYLAVPEQQGSNHVQTVVEAFLVSCVSNASLLS